jgi:hypothetical protein
MSSTRINSAACLQPGRKLQFFCFPPIFTMQRVALVRKRRHNSALFRRLIQSDAASNLKTDNGQAFCFERLFNKFYSFQRDYISNCIVNTHTKGGQEEM